MLEDLSHLTDRAIGKLFREAFAEHLAKTWGPLQLDGAWLSSVDKKKILIRYSNRAAGRDSWFYDVKQKDWEKWDATNHHLAFLMRHGPECSYLILSPEESKYLLDGSKSAADMSKKIDIRVSATGRIYIIQWKDLEITDRIQKLGHSHTSAEKTYSPESRSEASTGHISSFGRVFTKSSSEHKKVETRPLEDLLKEIKEIRRKVAALPRRGDVETEPDADESQFPPKTSDKSRDITHLIERSYEIEKALKLGIYGVYAKESSGGQITVNGEVRANPGEPLPKDLTVIITFHDSLGRIQHVEQVSCNSSSHLGSHVFSVQWTAPSDNAEQTLAKIRIQPGARSDESAKPSRKGLMKKIFGWIKE